MEQEFTSAEQRAILGFVRGVISAAAGGGQEPEEPDIPRLREPGSCFVSLHESGELRGCIGSLEAFEPLGENLRRNAENAAFSDPRFPPLERDELNFVTLEVSVLTPPENIAAPEEFIPGRDGIIISCRGRRAVFLPQVAPEQGWSREETLCHLALKAGLPPEAWRESGTMFQIFQAEVFGE